MEVDRVQPRPSRRDRSRDPEGPLGDSAPTDHRHPRPDRDHQPPSRPSPTRLLALGIGVEPAVGQHDRTANLRRLLTIQPAPARPEDPMESVRSGYRRPPETQSRSNQESGDPKIRTGGSGLRARSVRVSAEVRRGMRSQESSQCGTRIEPPRSLTTVRCQRRRRQRRSHRSGRARGRAPARSRASRRRSSGGSCGESRPHRPHWRG